MSEKRSRGQPTKYEPKYVELAFWMAQAGLTDKQMAHEMGVTDRTINNWKKEHPEFFQSIRDGKDTPDEAVEAALLRKAKGFKYEEGGKPRVALPDTTACIFWLKNRRPDKWRDKHEIDQKTHMTFHFDEARKPEDVNRD
jgi:DNA-binding XRE family transcriptional regulator